MAKLLSFGIGVLFIAVGAWIAYYSWVSGGWPTAPAIVTQSQVTWEEDDDGSKTSQAQVSYNFQVGGHAYFGNTVAYDDTGSVDSSRAQGIVDEYPVGKTIQIHYEPGSPESSVIRGGSVGPLPLILMGAGVLFCAAALFFILKNLVFLGLAFFFSRVKA